MEMDIREIARLLDPEEFEWYAAELVAGSKPIRRIGRAIHVLDHEHVPALILCKHVRYDIHDVFNLNDLMIKHHFKRGYLITPGEFDEAIHRAAQAVTGEIRILDGRALDDLRCSAEDTYGTEHHQ